MSFVLLLCLVACVVVVACVCAWRGWGSGGVRVGEVSRVQVVWVRVLGGRFRLGLVGDTGGTSGIELVSL